MASAYNPSSLGTPTFFDVRPGVAAAVAERRPVVALESTLVTHGLPAPENLEIALALEAAVRGEKAEPATIGILEGRLVVGLSEDELRRLAEADDAAKVSRRDLAPTLATGGSGGTTVAATMWAAARAGIGLLATGGIGGVHRGGETSLDVSADLEELAQTRVAVVCAGAKAILDLGRTLEALETRGVPVVGFGTLEFPAFYSTTSGFPASHRLDRAEDVARLLTVHWQLDPGGGVLIANPPPADEALDRDEVEEWIESALAEASADGVTGAAVTPFVLDRLARVSRGRTIEVNRALLISNARVAARIAVAWSELSVRGVEERR